MSATRPYYVKVVKTCTEWIRVSAVTENEAEGLAMRESGVIDVKEIRYTNPEDDT